MVEPYEVCLVIDDNKDLTEAIYDSLDSPDIECTMINDGKAGLDEILKERGKYNLILLDIAYAKFQWYGYSPDTKEGRPFKIRKYYNIYGLLYNG